MTHDFITLTVMNSDGQQFPGFRFFVAHIITYSPIPEGTPRGARADLTTSAGNYAVAETADQIDLMIWNL